MDSTGDEDCDEDDKDTDDDEAEPSLPAALPLVLEPPDIGGTGGLVVHEEVAHLVLGEHGGVVEVEDPGRRHHAVLGRSLGSVEPGNDECSQQKLLTVVFFWHPDLNSTKLNRNLYCFQLEKVGGEALWALTPYK